MSSLRPFHNLDSFQQLVDSVFGRSPGFSMPADAGLNLPATDISESAEEYLISAELPGVKKEDIHVSLHEGMLTIEAESRSEHEEKGDKQIRNERRYGKYVRRFSLGNVDESNINAQYQDGILKLAIRKQEPQQPQPKSITID